MSVVNQTAHLALVGKIERVKAPMIVKLYRQQPPVRPAPASNSFGSLT
jgi:hypothetical protein